MGTSEWTIVLSAEREALCGKSVKSAYLPAISLASLLSLSSLAVCAVLCTECVPAMNERMNKHAIGISVPAKVLV